MGLQLCADDPHTNPAASAESTRSIEREPATIHRIAGDRSVRQTADVAESEGCQATVAAGRLPGLVEQVVRDVAKTAVHVQRVDDQR